MSTQTATYDVFLSYSLAESPTASIVVRAFQGAGLGVFNQADLEPGEDYRDAIWYALRESAAMVVVLPPQPSLPASVAVEVGAFMALDKPIYIVHSAVENAKLPTYLADYRAYPISRIDDMVLSIKRGLQRLSEEDEKLLSEIYRDLGMPLDQLISDPDVVDELAREFGHRAGKAIPGERLVGALLVLRKRKRLPRIRR